MNDTINTIKSKVIKETLENETETILLLLNDGEKYIIAEQDYESEEITAKARFAEYEKANNYYMNYRKF